MSYKDILNNGSYDAVILANGEQPEHDIPTELLQEAPYIVCCDGAINYCDWADAVVGDGDSIPSWAMEEYECIFHQEEEQEDNDLTKATRFCVERGFKKIVYLGATGLREDHTLGNISLLMRYFREMGVEPIMATNHGWFVPASGSCSFASFLRQQVSIFNFGCTSLRTEGLRYDGYPFQQWWQGTLNEATSDSFRVEADGDYLVFRTYEGK
ncbi:thiamine diphosphokinase [Prevotella sp. E13-27]|uniref:thiamine diphosphokinase n=1 Tax=Prevotella sp. E13-27 TaxID=2938122 RepID=UPI00200B9ABC|nr:thiamine diphosphokinase [Prevotella sp. E13-27]MCK8621245.1 thiamine diphosphokinase [Prevotella sp. E13-27]